MFLYRAMSQAERDDLALCGTLQVIPGGYSTGKWFALIAGDAHSWGRRFQVFDGQPYYVAQIKAPDQWRPQARTLATIEGMVFLSRLDNIGAALFVPSEQLGMLQVLQVEPMQKLD